MNTTNSPIIGLGRSREGAWIEIATCEYHRAYCEVAPARERGLKFLKLLLLLAKIRVAPARERGLKSPDSLLLVIVTSSLPRGSVD